MRSLILAGGGIKVGYQAGCLEVLLDEVGLEFDHVDGASGGCFNAAMIASGLGGKQIADAWRRLDPFDMVAFNWREFSKLFWARSIWIRVFTKGTWRGWRCASTASTSNGMRARC